jgi:hypothetical protein
MGMLVFFAVLVGLVSAQSDPYQQLSNHWFNRCFNQSGNQTKNFDKLYSDGVEFKRYLKFAFQFLPREQKIFCERERPILDNKMAELTRDVRLCLMQQEKFFENFLYQSFKELLHFLCHNGGENVNTFFSSKATECRNKLFNTDYPHLENCFGKIFKPTSGVIVKKDICGHMGVVKKCFAEALEYQCPSFGSYKKLNDDFFNYVSQPCAGCAFYINSMLLTASLLVSFIFNRK